MTELWVLVGDEGNTSTNYKVWAVFTDKDAAVKTCDNMNAEIARHLVAMEAWYVPQRKLDPRAYDIREQWKIDNPAPKPPYPYVCEFALQGPFEPNIVKESS